jgi:3-methyladenine DNA glycosylase Mpg
MAARNLDLGPMALMSVTAGGNGAYVFDLCAEVSCEDEHQAAILVRRAEVNCAASKTQRERLLDRASANQS